MVTRKSVTTAASSSLDESFPPFLNQDGINIIQRYATPRIYLGYGRFGSYKNKGEEFYKIGYDSTHINKRAVNFFTKSTIEEINKQLVEDLKVFAKQIQEYVFANLNDKKKAAVLSYAHSVGLAVFKESYLLELINTFASKKAIIKEWSPLINSHYLNVDPKLKERRRVELNFYLAPDKKVPLFFEHKCQLNQCLLNIGESYLGTPNQVKAIEYLERKLLEFDPSQETLRRFWRYWNQEQGGLGSSKTI